MKKKVIKEGEEFVFKFVIETPFNQKDIKELEENLISTIYERGFEFLEGSLKKTVKETKK